MRVPLGQSSFNRSFGRDPEIFVLNRFFEQDPTNQTDGVSLLSRPGSVFEAAFGAGPIRKQFNLPGLHEGDNFIVSGDAFYRYDVDGNSQLVSGTVSLLGAPSMCGVKGDGYQRVFIADGASLQYYGGQAYSATLTLTPGAIHDDLVRVDDTYYRFSSLLDAAQGVLTCSGTIADDVVKIDTKYYQFATTPSGSHAGTVGDPYQVKVNGSNTNALANLRKAINASGVSGTDYDSGVTIHATVAADYSNATAMGVHAKTAGTGGNAISTTVTATGGSDGLAWTAATLAGGQAASAGTLANPHHVYVSTTDALALANLRAAVNATGVAGTDYSTAVTANTRVTANANTALTVSVRGRVAGALSPVAAVSVTAFGSADGLAWDVAQLTAGAHVLYGVPTPDDIGIVSVAELGSFVLCVQANSQKVYFIRPGETTIDPLDFFTAESNTDDLIEAMTVGDQVWLIGQKSIEPWALNGTTDPDATPFSRIQGRPFSIGALEGTVVFLANSVFLVGSDKIVYRIQGGPEPISNPAIVERVRKALEAEKANA